MQDLVASKTSMTTSLMRALHTRTDPQPLFNDPWGDKLVSTLAINFVHQKAMEMLPLEALEAASAGGTSVVDLWLHTRPYYTSVITRSRFTEDALHAAIKRGVRQYVVMGAGFDSYCLRRPHVEPDLTVFEIDHPATQLLKRQRLVDCGAKLPQSVQFIAADLAKEGLADALLRSSFKITEPVFISWLGVTMYLSREDNLKLLRSIGQCAAPGSEVAFSYIDQAVFRGNTQTGPFADMQRSVTAVGEPLLSGFDPAELAKDLRSVGLSLEEDLDDAQALLRYDEFDTNRLTAVASRHVARASVPAAGH
jgi:methyltransferase (TIGR00027 family)